MIMNAIRCPRCLIHEQSYKAPLGQCIRNPYADLTKAVYDPCIACEGTGYVSTLVVESICNAFPKDPESILASLRWSGDHFSFIRWGMYIGVELDGYIHS